MMDIVQQFEQMGAMLRDLAPILAKYEADLKRAGFPASDAFVLVRDYQKLLFKTPRRKSEDGG